MKTTCVWVGAALLLATTTNAQQQGDTTLNATLDEVVVTANKLAQKQSQTGKVITVINKETLVQNQGKSVAQIINETAGVTINGALNTPGTNQVVYTRGSSSGRTLILLDGIPVYDPSLIGNEFDLNFLGNGLIDRIEVARGAQSTLYGSDAIGGVINIITKASGGQQKPLLADAGTSYGSFNTSRSFANLYGHSGKFSYQAGFQHLSSDGFSAANDKQSMGNFDKDGINQNTAQARLGYAFAPGIQLSGFVNFSQYQADLDAGAFTDDRDFTNTTQNLLSGLVFDLKRSNWDARIQYAYGNVQRNLLNDSGHVSGFSKFMRDDYAGKSHFIEGYGTIKLSKAMRLLAGFDYRNASMNNDFLSISSFGPFNSSFEDTSVYLGSFFNSLLIEKNNFNFEGGFRINTHETFGTYTTFTINPSFKINNQWRVFGSVASGFKAPSLYQLYSSAGNPDLNPEKSINYEGGIAFTKGKSNTRVVLFYRDIEKGLDFDYVNFKYFNSGRQQVKGIEWEGIFQMGNKFAITANYTWLDAKENTQSRLNTKDTTYHYLLKRPEHKGFVTLQYTPNKKLTLSANALAVSERKDVGGFQQADVSLDGYIIYGMQASFKPNEKITLFADVQNMFDKIFVDINGFNSMRRNVQGGVRLSL